MNWLVLIQFLLKLANLVMNKLSEQELRKVIQDETTRKLLSDLAIKAKVSKAIDLNINNADDDDIDRILQSRYRAEGEQDGGAQ